MADDATSGISKMAVTQETEVTQELLQTEVTHETVDMESAGEPGKWDGAPHAAGWLPPGADAAGGGTPFGEDMEPHFIVPERLRDKNSELVEAANDFHYAMVNDHARNEFYREALRRVVNADTHVLEIGTGSGLLAMIAAQAGAKHVTAVEANCHMAFLAKRIIHANGLSDKITVINKLSTEMSVEELGEHGRADVLLSEILGTLMLGESALEYNADVRDRRLLKPGGILIPCAGKQFVTLIESSDLEDITSVKGWGGLDLSGLNLLQDTASLVFTKQYGFRFGTMPHRIMAEKVTVADVDFAKHSPGFLPHEARHTVTARYSGIVHAALLTWEVYGDTEHPENLVMSTDPVDTVDNFARDMQWGQGLQLLEDHDVADPHAPPVPFRVEEGEELELVVRFSEDSVVVQCELRRKGAAAATEACTD